MNYREGLIYQALEKILTNAGIGIIYQEVPDDHIDGAIWARSDHDACMIMMPNDPEEFPDEETACLVLGHEAGHLLSGLDSPDFPSEREKNEAVCDLIGVYLSKLAEMTAGYELEKKVFG